MENDYKQISSYISFSFYITILSYILSFSFIYNLILFLYILLICVCFCLIINGLLIHKIKDYDLPDILICYIFIIPIFNLFLWWRIFQSENIKIKFFQWTILNPLYIYTKTKYFLVYGEDVNKYAGLSIIKGIKNSFYIKIKNDEDLALYYLVKNHEVKNHK